MATGAVVAPKLAVADSELKSMVTKGRIKQAASKWCYKMSLEDLDFVATMLADPQVMRFYPKCYSRVESATWIERQLERYSRDGHGLWLVLERGAGQPVGQVGLAGDRRRRLNARASAPWTKGPGFCPNVQ